LCLLSIYSSHPTSWLTLANAPPVAGYRLYPPCRFVFSPSAGPTNPPRLAFLAFPPGGLHHLCATSYRCLSTLDDDKNDYLHSVDIVIVSQLQNSQYSQYPPVLKSYTGLRSFSLTLYLNGVPLSLLRSYVPSSLILAMLYGPS
jgi:hypothetical protein